MRASLAIRSILLLAALPVPMARAATDQPRFTVTVDFTHADLSGPGLDVGLQTNNDITFTGGSVVGLDVSRTATPRLAFVYHSQFGDQLEVAYRRYDQTEGEVFRSSAGFFPTLPSPGTGIDFANRIESSVDVTMDTADVEWSRALASGQHMVWYWSAGVRWLQYESDWKTDYDWGADKVRIREETSGLGLTLGISGRYTLANRFSLICAGGLGLLRGSVDASFEEKAPAATAAIVREDEDRLLQTYDMEARLSYALFKEVDLSLGYQFSRAAGLATRERIADDVLRGTLASTEEDVDLDGVVFGIAVHW